MNEKLKLTSGAQMNPVWISVREEVERLVAIDRKKLEKDASKKETAKLRGRILAFETVLDFGRINPNTEEA